MKIILESVTSVFTDTNYTYMYVVKRIYNKLNHREMIYQIYRTVIFLFNFLEFSMLKICSQVSIFKRTSIFNI